MTQIGVQYCKMDGEGFYAVLFEREDEEFPWSVIQVFEASSTRELSLLIEYEWLPENREAVHDIGVLSWYHYETNEQPDCITALEVAEGWVDASS